MTNVLTNSILALVQALIVTVTPVTSTNSTQFKPSNYAIPTTEQCITVSGPILHIGSKSKEVKDLQRILNMAPDTRVSATGDGSPGKETEYFGTLTKAAVIRFQEKYATEVLKPADLKNGTGLVGMYTRAKIRKMCELVVTSDMTQGDFVAGAYAAYNKLFKKPNNGNGGRGSSSGNNNGSTPPPVITPPPVVTPPPPPVVIPKATTTPVIPKATTTPIIPKPTPPPLVTTPPPPPPVVIPKPTTTPVVTPPATSAKMPANLEWGAFPGTNSPTSLSSFETLLGKQVKLRPVFTNWNDGFPLQSLSGLKSANKTAVIFWEQYGVTLDSIIAGNEDAKIKKFAEDARAYGGQIILSPFHEMNGYWSPWSGVSGQNTPEKAVLAWRHVHSTFGSVPNVKFAWTVNNVSVPNTEANAIGKYYPGDAYVDYVAIDGFNFGAPWQSFDSAFAKPMATLAAYKKPIYILSMASAPGAGKAAWITDAFTVQAAKYPLLKGWVWFNENKEHDWRINSDPASLAAFKAMLP